MPGIFEMTKQQFDNLKPGDIVFMFDRYENYKFGEIRKDIVMIDPFNVKRMARFGHLIYIEDAFLTENECLVAMYQKLIKKYEASRVRILC